VHGTKYQSRGPLYPRGNGTGKKVTVGSQNSPVAGRKLSTGGRLPVGFPMRGTVTATGRTFEVAVPTLRREQTGNGREQNCDPRKSEESQAKLLYALMGKFEQVSYSGPMSGCPEWGAGRRIPAGRDASGPNRPVPDPCLLAGGRVRLARTQATAGGSVALAATGVASHVGIPSRVVTYVVKVGSVRLWRLCTPAIGQQVLGGRGGRRFWRPCWPSPGSVFRAPERRG
jgi:hypothetical protein